MTKQVAKAEEAKLPATATDDDFEAYAGVGLEHITSSDLLVPRLAILQNLSPQLSKSKAEYIKGAEVGMIADVGTQETFMQGVWFLPVLYRKDYLEWAPRNSGKGLVKIHSDPAILDHCTRNDRNQPVLASGNYIAETAQFFGLNLSAGGRMCFIAMGSTQLKKARRWNTLAMGEKLKRQDGSEFTAPLFYRTYNLSTAEEGNSEGDWFGWVLERGPALPEINAEDHGFDWRQLKASALAFRESLSKGEARGDVAGLDSAGERSADGDEVPF